jgi:hypothetical protein
MKLAWTSCVAVAWGNFTAEGNLFPKKVRELLKHADESVQKVRALAQGELHVGYLHVPLANACSTSHSPARWKRSGSASAAPQWET